MKVERITIDSRVLGRDVLAIQDLDPRVQFPAFEAAYLREFAPAYVYCKVPIEDLYAVQYLEDQGFRLVECQLRCAVKLQRPFPVAAFRGYAFEPVTCEEDLAEVLDIAAATFVHDRWRVDAGLAPELAGERYRQYVRNSFQDPRESVYRLRDRESGRVLGFKTHRDVAPKEVLFLLGGVHPDFKNQGLGLINEYFEFNELMARGFRKGITHISAANYPVFNLEVGGLGFRVLTTFAVLRKLYL